MAKFKLGLLIQDIVQNSDNTNSLNYIEDIFTNFNYDDYYFTFPGTKDLVKTTTGDFQLPTTAINNNISFSYSYDESITFKENSQRQLQFKMLKYVQHNADFLLNPYAVQITNGTLIRLYDKYQNIYDFIVTKISYAIKNANVEISYECQDIFSYIHTRQNSGYTIRNDETREDFIGALTIDDWTQKIVDECKIAYKYMPLTSTIYKYKDENGKYKITNILPTTSTFTIIREPLTATEDSYDYNAAITFSISNSNALNALIQLAQQRGLNIQVDDNSTAFYFIPAKAEEFSGLYYSPQTDITNLSVGQEAQSLTTVLNVTGPTRNNSEITLLPSVPSMFLTLFSSNQWTQETYRPGYFRDFVKNKNIFNYSTDSSSADIIWDQDTDPNAPIIVYNFTVPFGDYTQVQIDPNFTVFYINNTIDTFSNWIENSIISSIVWSGDASISPIGTSEYIYNINNPQDQILKTGTLTITLNDSLNTIVGVNASIIFKRNSTQEEEEFAEMADKLPWLENKIINVDYFYKRQLLSKNDYSLLLDTLYNKLRIINGQLIYYNNLYYASLLKKMNIMVDLQNNIDLYSADLNIYINTNDNDAKDRAASSYDQLYNFTDNLNKKQTLLSLETTIQQYTNNYYQAEQTFFKNIYKFRQKWTDKVYFTIPGISISDSIYKDYTLGKFYEIYKDNNTQPALQQQAALIGTELKQYWDTAYSASKYCAWYLPEDFEDSTHRIYNAGNYNLINTYLPDIQIYTDNGSTYFNQGFLSCDLNWSQEQQTTSDLEEEAPLIYGRYIWSDGETYYHAEYDDFYQWDGQNKKWIILSASEHLTQTNLHYYGDEVWYYKDMIFTCPNSNNSRYMLFDKNTKKWSNYYTWGSGQSYDPFNIWYLDDQVYCSNGLYTYYLTGNSQNNLVWQRMIWKDQDNNDLYIFGSNIWHDHYNNIYYTYQNNSYQLNKKTGIWEKKNWNGDFIVQAGMKNIWYYKDNTFYSNNGQHYILNLSMNKWDKIEWTGIANNFQGEDIWQENNNIYYTYYSPLWRFYRLNNINYIQNQITTLPSYVDQAFNIDYLIVDDRKGNNKNIDFKSRYVWIEYSDNYKINYYTVVSGTGKQWNEMINRSNFSTHKLSDDRLPVGGIWVILIHILLNKYYKENFTILEEKTEEHNNIWRELYKNYGNYLLENSYTDSLATNSQDLYNSVMAFFKDQATPAKSYDLSILDIYALKGYTGQEIKVTDQIRIASQDFYQELDELKDILDQALFVKEIQYKLRSDTDIKLSVNVVQYQDKMIQRLVKLIV